MEQRLQAGDVAPAFGLANQDGQMVNLKDFAGKRVVLYFYPKDDTPGCTKEACGFRDALPSFADLEAVVLGISKDSVASHKKFAEKYQLPFALLSDEDLEVCKAYGVYQLKKNFGKESWGIVRSTFLIDRDGTVAKAWRNVKVDGHVDQVRDVLNQLD